MFLLFSWLVSAQTLGLCARGAEADLDTSRPDQTGCGRICVRVTRGWITSRPVSLCWVGRLLIPDCPCFRLLAAPSPPAFACVRGRCPLVHVLARVPCRGADRAIQRERREYHDREHFSFGSVQGLRRAASVCSLVLSLVRRRPPRRRRFAEGRWHEAEM